MKVIFLLITISLVVAAGFLAAFYWAVRSGQYEDDYTPSVRILFEDRPAGKPPERQDEAPEGEQHRQNIQGSFSAVSGLHEKEF